MATRHLSIWLLVLASCGRQEALRDPTQDPPAVLRHDFGEIPHGETRTHEFVVPTPGDGWIPLAFRAQCSCAIATFAIAGKDGQRRKIVGPTVPDHQVKSGESLILTLAIETGRKEAVDLAKVASQGWIVLGESRAENRRIEVPVEFTYGIQVAIRVLPKPHVDFGELPCSQGYTQTLALEPRDPARKVVFSNVRASRPEVSAKLIEKDGKTLLEVGFTPRTSGGTELRAYDEGILVATDLPNGYEVPIRVSGTVIPDIHVQPFDAIAFGQIDFATPTEQFVNLHDYDKRRDPGFVIQSVVDQNGVECGKHFTARLEPISGDARGTRLYLRYLGGKEGRVFRGTITLAKKNADGPVTVIPFHGFNKSS